MTRSNPPLLVVVGPTAVGKTAIAIELAHRFNGEIISADSRQVYRQMDIGTAKPTPEERAEVPHHLVDVLDPNEHLSLASFQELAYAAIADVTGRGGLPILVGGTGQYVQSVVEGWGIPQVEPHPALRADLEVYAEVYGPAVLHDWLRRVDPIAAKALDYRNVRRVVRALEVFLVSGKPISIHQHKNPPPYHTFQIGLTRPRDVLYRRIDRRVDQMMENGLLEEVRRLVAAEHDWDLPSMAGLGYRQFAAYVAEDTTLAETVALIKTETHRFVRHQDNWFRRDDPTIQWFDLEKEDSSDVINAVKVWLDSWKRIQE